MKFLALASSSASNTDKDLLSSHGHLSLPEFLSSQYNIPPELQAPLLALTLSRNHPTKTTVSSALPQMHRHLTSMGVFGPGFGAVLPKWGGLSEVSQVACRAQAVGGGVYVLKKGIEKIEESKVDSPSEGIGANDLSSLPLMVCLQGGDMVQTRWVVGSPSSLPPTSFSGRCSSTADKIQTTHLTVIVSHPLPILFPPTAESSPPPAATIVYFPSGSLYPSPAIKSLDGIPPVYLTVHSADTGECPKGQCKYFISRLHSNREKREMMTIYTLSTLSEIRVEDKTTTF